MNRRPSVFQRLALGLAFVGLVGTVLLLGAVVIEYQFTFENLATPDALAAALREMLEHVALPVLALLVPMALAGLWVIKKAFLPMRLAAKQIDDADTVARAFRIDTDAMPDEVLPFTSAVNKLLDRLDRSAAQHEAFAADIAHELRTPLAVLSLELDQLEHPSAPRLKAEVVSMARLIDQLMLLAQIDADQTAYVQVEQVDLADVCANVAAMLAPTIVRSGKLVELDSGSAQVKVLGRREAIAAALRNLVENGVRVTPVGGTILIRVTGDACIHVQDGGAGLTSARLSEVIKRNRRSDHANPDGAGLGLAIVARIMMAHGGTLTSNPNARELTLTFPKTV
jgi:two-component system, OmpR family, sensor kinase